MDENQNPAPTAEELAGLIGGATPAAGESGQSDASIGDAGANTSSSQTLPASSSSESGITIAPESTSAGSAASGTDSTASATTASTSLPANTEQAPTGAVATSQVAQGAAIEGGIPSKPQGQPAPFGSAGAATTYSQDSRAPQSLPTIPRPPAHLLEHPITAGELAQTSPHAAMIYGGDPGTDLAAAAAAMNAAPAGAPPVVLPTKAEHVGWLKNLFDQLHSLEHKLHASTFVHPSDVTTMKKDVETQINRLTNGVPPAPGEGEED